MDWLSKVLVVHKIPFQIVLWLTLVSGVLTIASDEFLKSLRLHALLQDHGTYVGLAFLLSGSLVVINGSAWLIEKKTEAKRRLALQQEEAAQRAREERQEVERRDEIRRRLVNSVAALDPAEKAVLREFWIQGKNTIELPQTDATVAGLEGKGIVEQQGTFGYQALCGFVFPYAIADDARPVVSPEKIDLPQGTLTDNDRRRLRQTRPAFVGDIRRHHELFGV